MSSSRRFARVLSDVRQEIDNFLDPAVLKLVDHDSKPSGSGLKAESASDLQLELLGAQSEGNGLRAELDEIRREAEKQRREADRRASHDAAEIHQLTRKRNEFEEKWREKRSRVNKVESERLRLQSERDTLDRECEDLQNRLASSVREHEAQKQRLKSEVQTLREELQARSSTSAAASLGTSAGGDWETKALRDRNFELEREVASLRLLLEQAAPERDEHADLRRHHMECQEKLQAAHATQEQYQTSRALVLRLEQEVAELRAALDVRSEALRSTEDELHEAKKAKLDADAYKKAADAIIAEAPQYSSEATGEPRLDASLSTPSELSRAWGRCQLEVVNLRRRCDEMQRDKDQAEHQSRRMQDELRQIRVQMATSQARSEELQLDLKRARDEIQTQSARMKVLREAISKYAVGESPALQSSGLAEGEDLKLQLDKASSRASDAEEKAEARQRALESISAEFESLKQEHSRLTDVEARAGQLQRQNDKLWSANRELEQDQERLEAEVAANRDFNPATTKILHLRHGPGGSMSSSLSEGSSMELQALRTENAALREEGSRLRAAIVGQGGSVAATTGSSTSFSSSSNLEDRQAARHLDRFKKATKKYVQDFREGTYGLLGWKVEMRGDGSSMKWHLTSRYLEGHELVFQLQAQEAGRPPEFDLLETEWAEQLQGDPQAMAYLKFYNSIPGFLAHLTTDIVTRQTLHE